MKITIAYLKAEIKERENTIRITRDWIMEAEKTNRDRVERIQQLNDEIKQLNDELKIAEVL